MKGDETGIDLHKQRNSGVAGFSRRARAFFNDALEAPSTTVSQSRTRQSPKRKASQPANPEIPKRARSTQDLAVIPLLASSEPNTAVNPDYPKSDEHSTRQQHGYLPGEILGRDSGPSKTTSTIPTYHIRSLKLQIN